jgi:hypothetical protein
MAHPTDYASIRDISKLKLSNRFIDVPHLPTHGDTLVYNFIRQNANWSIDSIVNYCLQFYSEFGVDKQMIAKHMKSYILEK